MAILEITPDRISPLPQTTIAEERLRERADLQRLLRASIDVLGKDLMIVAEEFASWEDSRRRIDLLGLDRDGNLVVIEIKRTDDGGHMELQALRYAAMISPMTFDQVVEAHRDYLESTGVTDSDPRESILDFLQWDEPNDELFAQAVRIVLVSMDFSREITTTVMWLNQQGLDIRCIRLTPYKHGASVLLDVQQIIPLPEAADFQTRVREKQRSKSRVGRRPDLTRFTLRLNGNVFPSLPKRQAMLQVFRHLAAAGVDPNSLADHFGGRNPDRTIRRYPGTTSSAEILHDLQQHTGSKRGPLHPKRWFYGPDDLIHFNGDTYVVSTQWGRHAERYLRNLAEAFPNHRIEIDLVPQDE